MTTGGRFLLVELAGDLAAEGTTRGVVFICLGLVPGVLRVTDLAAVSEDTLREWLLPPEESWRTIPRKGKR